MFSMTVQVFGADEIMDRGIRRYLRGDYQAAIEDFTRVLELEENERASRLLVNSLTEEGKNSMGRGDHERALVLFRSANEIEPSREISDLITEAEEAAGLAEPTPAPSTPSPEPSPRIAELESQLRRERQAAATLRNRLNTMEAQRNELNRQLERTSEELSEASGKISRLEDETRGDRRSLFLIALAGGGGALIVGLILIILLKKVYSTASSGTYQIEELEEKISERLKEAEKESEQLEEKVARSINQMIDGQKNMVKQISLSSGGKTQQDIEEIKDSLHQQFESQQQRLLDLLQQQSTALSKEKTEKVELPSGRVITDVNPHVRARADSVELIPKTVSDPQVAEKMLRPYLTDPNNRVRANAAREIHRYNPGIAIDTLEKMVGSGDKWMRLSAAWAIGEVGAPESVHILRKLLDDVDEKVRDRAVKAFESMAQVKSDVGDEIRRMIKRQEKEGTPPEE